MLNFWYFKVTFISSIPALHFKPQMDCKDFSWSSMTSYEFPGLRMASEDLEETKRIHKEINVILSVYFHPPVRLDH